MRKKFDEEIKKETDKIPSTGISISNSIKFLKSEKYFFCLQHFVNIRWYRDSVEINFIFIFPSLSSMADFLCEEENFVIIFDNFYFHYFLIGQKRSFIQGKEIHIKFN